MVGTVTQKPPEVVKPWANQVQAKDANEEDEAGAVVEEGFITKNVSGESGTSNAHDARH